MMSWRKHAAAGTEYYYSRCKTVFVFKQSPKATAPASPMRLERKLLTAIRGTVRYHNKLLPTIGATEQCCSSTLLQWPLLQYSQPGCDRGCSSGYILTDTTMHAQANILEILHSCVQLQPSSKCSRPGFSKWVAQQTKTAMVSG
jgi:hypothetical protein